jgi:hypothetical protein
MDHCVIFLRSSSDLARTLVQRPISIFTRHKRRRDSRLWRRRRRRSPMRNFQSYAEKGRFMHHSKAERGRSSGFQPTAPRAALCELRQARLRPFST